MKHYNILLFILLILSIGFCITVYSQDSVRYKAQTVFGIKDFDDSPRPNGLRIMFYNVENLFDPRHDSLKNDLDFTPTGMKGWTFRKFYEKINNIYRVIISLGGWEPPDIIGLCEVENEFCFKQLVTKSPLKKFNYRYVHFESPDKRGVDVGCIYRPDKFKVIHKEPIRITFPFAPESKTRDILYVRGIVKNKDTLHFFVNHWPSRLGGQIASAPRRKVAAETLRKKVDSIFAHNPKANIVIVGDFNDYPDDESIINVLKAKPDTLNLKYNELYNTMYQHHVKGKIGTHKHEEKWGVLDHIIVSGNLVKSNTGLRLKKGIYGNIFYADFLLTEDTKYLGVVTNRTYIGARYNGGYADHLPVYIDLTFEN